MGTMPNLSAIRSLAPSFFSLSRIAACAAQSCHRYTERRARNVIQPDPMTEICRLGIAAVFAADAGVELGRVCGRARLRSALACSHAALVEGHKRIVPQNPLLEILHEEPAFGIVPRDAEGGLGQIVGPDEKNSAYSASWSAMSAARGTSIIVPNW